MQRIKDALEQLDEMISSLEDRVRLDAAMQRDGLKKQAEALRTSRTRETQVLAVAQKVASRLDQTIQHVEHVLRN